MSRATVLETPTPTGEAGWAPLKGTAVLVNQLGHRYIFDGFRNGHAGFTFEDFDRYKTRCVHAYASMQLAMHGKPHRALLILNCLNCTWMAACVPTWSHTVVTGRWTRICVRLNR
jgi:hypothetical protein